MNKLHLGLTAALWLCASAASANVTFQGSINTVPYDPAQTIVVSSQSAPGVHEHWGQVPGTTAFAYGNLEQGILRASVYGQQEGYQVSASIRLTDRLQIAGTEAPTIDVDLSAYVNGDFYLTSFSAGAALIMQARDAGTGALVSERRFLVQDTGCHLWNHPSVSCVEVEAGDGTLTGTFALPLTSSGWVDFSVSLSASAINFGVADAGHSAFLRLNVPAGVTVSSQSGAFLAEVTSAVPEPSAAVLFASGGLLLSWMKCRRRHDTD